MDLQKERVAKNYKQKVAFGNALQKTALEDIKRGHPIVSITNKFKMLFLKQQADLARQEEEEEAQMKREVVQETNSNITEEELF